MNPALLAMKAALALLALLVSGMLWNAKQRSKVWRLLVFEPITTRYLFVLNKGGRSASDRLKTSADVKRVLAVAK
jgi:hypothetical protein